MSVQNAPTPAFIIPLRANFSWGNHTPVSLMLTLNALTTGQLHRLRADFDPIALLIRLWFHDYSRDHNSPVLVRAPWTIDVGADLGKCISRLFGLGNSTWPRFLVVLGCWLDGWLARQLATWVVLHNAAPLVRAIPTILKSVFLFMRILGTSQHSVVPCLAQSQLGARSL